MSTENELVTSFARMQACEDARLFAQEMIFAGTLPKDHPMQVTDCLADGPQLLSCIRFRAAILLGRLEAGRRSEVASVYATAYLQGFLRALQKELLVYLGAAHYGLLPDESQPKAQAALAVVEALLGEHIAAQRWFRVTISSEGHDPEPMASLCEEDLLSQYPHLALRLARPDFAGCRWEECTPSGRRIISILPAF